MIHNSILTYQIYDIQCNQYYNMIAQGNILIIHMAEGGRLMSSADGTGTPRPQRQRFRKFVFLICFSYFECFV